MKYITVLLFCTVSFASCFLYDGKRVKGNGERGTATREISGFTGVSSSGDFDVYLSTGTKYSVKLEGDANLLEYIETVKNGDHLRIKVRDHHNLRYRRGMKAYITAPLYEEVKVMGSGNIVGQDVLSGGENMEVEIMGSGSIQIEVKAQKVSAAVGGSGDISISGAADKLESSIGGSGNIRAGSLKTGESSVQIAGSGNASVNASDQLNIEILGSGGVQYSGEPKINQRIMGSGEVSKVH